MGDFWAWATKWTVGGATAAAAFMTLLGIIIRQKPIMRKLHDEREGSLLKERAADMRGMRRRITELEAEVRINGHTIANLQQCLTTLLTLIEVNPERAKEAAIKVRAMQAEMTLAQAAEKAGLYAQTIANAAEDEA